MWSLIYSISISWGFMIYTHSQTPAGSPESETLGVKPSTLFKQAFQKIPVHVVRESLACVFRRYYLLEIKSEPVEVNLILWFSSEHNAKIPPCFFSICICSLWRSKKCLFGAQKSPFYEASEGLFVQVSLTFSFVRHLLWSRGIPFPVTGEKKGRGQNPPCALIVLVRYHMFCSFIVLWALILSL